MVYRNTKQLINDIKTKSETHPDESRRNLYKVVAERLNDKNDPIKRVLFKSYKKRKDLNSTHFANVVSHAFEHFFLEGEIEPHIPYTQFETHDWNYYLEKILNTKEYLQKVITFLETNRTQTNKYQRYLGPKILISRYFGDKKINILDIGCSLNLGLMGLKTNEPFSEVIDHTEDQYIQKHLTNSIKIGEATGVDLHDPRKNRQWILACNFYPSESHQISDFVKKLAEIEQNAKDVNFIEGNAIKINEIWKQNKLNKVDVIIMSTVLYQLSSQERKHTLENARKILGKNGIIIINDFVSVKNSKLNWNKNWFGSGPSFSTILIRKNKPKEPLEFVKWKNARCIEVFEGSNFKEIIQN